VVLLLEGYNLSGGTPMTMARRMRWSCRRGRADVGLADRGEVPTLWLQHHLYSPAHIRWYDVAASFVYFSHFVTR